MGFLRNAHPSPRQKPVKRNFEEGVHGSAGKIDTISEALNLEAGLRLVRFDDFCRR